MTHFIFTGEDVITYNDRISYHYPFKTDFPFSVPAKEFLSFVSASEEDIQLIKTAEGIINVKSGKAKASFNVVVSNDLGEALDKIEDSIFDQEAEWLPLPKDFVNGLALCQFSVGGDELQNTLTNLYVTGCSVISCDGRRASFYEMDEEITSDYFMIKNKAVKEVAKFKPVAYLLKDNWLHFMDDNQAVLSARNTEGEYPVDDVVGLMEKVKGKKFNLPADDFIKAINVTSIMSESEVAKEKLIRIIFEDKKITCFGKKAKGESSYEITCDTVLQKDEKMEITLNPDFLKEILSTSSSVEIDTEIKKALFTSGSKFQHILPFK